MNLFNKVEQSIVNNIWKNNTWKSKLLTPFSLFYLLIHSINFFCTKKHKAKIPVICVGNITAGGSGKTPIVLAIGEILKRHKKDIAFIGHGYKASLLKHTTCIFVDFKMHNVNDVGDEAILLSNFAPTYIARKRIQALFAAQADDCEIAILDDGFQDNSIKKNLSILVIDANYILGNLFLLPAGPLRELPSIALKRADLIIISGIDEEKIQSTINSLLNQFSKKVPYLVSKITYCIVVPKEIEKFQNKDFFAIIGIAHPQKFLETAKKHCINIKAHAIFPDHHLFDDTGLDAIYNHANVLKCNVITSTKDFVRLPKKYQAITQVMDIEVKFHKYEMILSILQQKGLI